MAVALVLVPILDLALMLDQGNYEAGNKKALAEQGLFVTYNGGPDETRTRDLRRDRPAF